jgi:spore coat protein JB
MMLEDLQMYLNTHPNDARALDQFNRISMELSELKKCYEQKHGPLLGFGFGTNTGRTWRWIEQPWPWEM